jgi:protein-S-isoprenylcysteine O-methyltransferase Ste14
VGPDAAPRRGRPVPARAQPDDHECVLTILAGEALLLGSRAIAAWFVTFAMINHLYFILLEEPGLARRFGASYEEYRQAVPRWLPQLRRW